MKHQKQSEWRNSVVALLITLLTLVVTASAQVDQARISGSVHDQVGAVIPGATITVKNDRTGETRTATSTQEGSFLVTNLKPSVYTVTVTSASFAKTEYTSVELVVG